MNYPTQCSSLDGVLCAPPDRIRVLENEKVEDLISDKSVLAMRADWTQPSEKIGEFLSDHGRFGIPFNVVYGPGASDCIPLPELLTVT